MTFRIGMKVVCIYSGPWQLHGHEAAPSFGGVYTIRRIAADTNSGLGFLFDEISNKPDHYLNQTGIVFREKHFRGSRFRPAVSRKTDISIFQAMLTPSPVTVDEMNVADHAREIVR